MILPVHDRVRAHVMRLLVQLYALDAADAPPVVLDYPPNRELGDLGTPVAFELARRLRKAPRAIAQEIAGAFGTLEGVTRVAAAPNGYLNFFLERRGFLLDRLGRAAAAPAAAATKAIVEHTAINPNKAAHIGHLRNSALGDTLVRVLRFRGIPVEVQNYIDDTGVQVADVVVGFRVLEGKTLEQIRASPTRTRFDFYCWDLYARVTEWYEQDKERLKHRTETLHDIEHGGNEAADDRRLHRRSDRPLPPQDDGAAERRLRPAHVGRRHPPAQVLGPGVRRAEGQRRRLPAEGRTARRLLGHGD